MAQVIKYEELDGFNKNSDGTYEYTFYDYTYILGYSPIENKCIFYDTNYKQLIEFIKTINNNEKIKKILCFYSCDKGLIDPLNMELKFEINPHKSKISQIFTFEKTLKDILKFKKNIIVEYLDTVNNPNHKDLNDKHNLSAYLWNNGFNGVLQFICGSGEYFLNLSEDHKYLGIHYHEKNVFTDKFQTKLTLKFDPNLVPP